MKTEKKTGKKNKLFYRIMAVMLSAVMLLGLAACGKTGKEASNDPSKDSQGSQVDADGSFVWVPSYQTLPSVEEEGRLNVIGIVGSRLYYADTTYEEEGMSSQYCYIDLENGDGKPVKVYEFKADDTDKEYQTYIDINAVSQDGGIVMIVTKFSVITDNSEAAYTKQMQETINTLIKVSDDGSIVFELDITPDLKNLNEENGWTQQVLTDKDSNIYLSYGSYVLLYDKEGNHLSNIKPESDSPRNYISTMGLLPDGRIAIKQENASRSLELWAYNQDKQTFCDIYSNIPEECYNSGLGIGLEGGVLLTTYNSLIEYDLETQTYTEILKWIDCDINPDYVNLVTATPDGQIISIVNDWGSNETELIMITKTPASEVVQKEIITLGCISLSQNLQKSVVDFNKSSEEYRILIKDYSESSENGVGDAITRLNNDVLTGNAPDLIVPDYLNMDQLASKGVIEDLGAYLEKSDVVSRSDLFESILEAYTRSGVLCAIPSTFYMTTMFGRTSDVGEDMGWTFDEMIAYGKQYPDAAIYAGATQFSILDSVLMFDFDSYVNWETGECSFDTPEFMQVLEYAAGYPEEQDYETSEVKLIRNGEALLYLTSIDGPYGWQLVENIYGEPVTAIGYPTAGSSGTMVMGSDGVCISASSSHKDGAWAFIENMMTKDSQSNNFMAWGFPIRKDAYEDMMQEAMVVEYVYDENGEILLDDNGEPVMRSNMGYGWGDISFDLYAVTQEEKDHITETINNTGGMVQYNIAGIEIILEEVAPYFAGDKNVDEVAEIIQSRLKIFINENR